MTALLEASLQSFPIFLLICYLEDPAGVPLNIRARGSIHEIHAMKTVGTTFTEVLDGKACLIPQVLHC